MPDKKRQLAAIMFTDMEGYTTLMQDNEAAALKQRAKHREIFESSMEKFGGKILQYFGDGTLSIFDSAIEAVRCGIAMQHRFLKIDPVIPVRIGIQTGDIIYSKEDIIGDGVNVASRIESLAVAGSVFISGKVFDELKNQPDINARFMGVFELKNVQKPMEVYAISDGVLALPDAKNIDGKGKLISLKGEVLTAEVLKEPRFGNEKIPGANRSRAVIIAILSILILAMGGFIIKEQFFPAAVLDSAVLAVDSTQGLGDTLLRVDTEVDSGKDEGEILILPVVESSKKIEEEKVTEDNSKLTHDSLKKTDWKHDSLDNAERKNDSMINAETAFPINYLELTANRTGFLKGYNALGETVITGKIRSSAQFATYVNLVLKVTFLSEDNQRLKDYFKKIEKVISPGKLVEFKLKLRAPSKSKDFELKLFSAEGLLKN